jgi:hypothetical protein
MRRFCSYGPIDTEEHYYAPREELNQYPFLLKPGIHKIHFLLLFNLLL